MALKSISKLNSNIINGTKFLNREAGYKDECKLMIENLKKYGLCFMETPYYDSELHSRYNTVIQNYYEDRHNNMKGDKHYDCRPELDYMRGLLPIGVYEKVNTFQKYTKLLDNFLKKLSPDNQPFTDFNNLKEDKAYYIYKLIDLHKEDLINKMGYWNNVIVDDIDDFEEVTDEWGGKLVQVSELATDMISEGLDLGNSLKDLTKYSEQLLSPTCTDMTWFKPNEAIIKVHYDRDLFGVHAQSAYPGLIVWTCEKDPQRYLVRTPPGCFLIQAGMQLEWVTGGIIKSGFHEVVATEEAIEKANKDKQEGKSTWRATSIVFSQIRYDRQLKTLPELEGKTGAFYPPLEMTKNYDFDLDLIDQYREKV